MWSSFQNFFKFLHNLGVFLRNFAERKSYLLLFICYVEEYHSGFFFFLVPIFNTSYYFFF